MSGGEVQRYRIEVPQPHPAAECGGTDRDTAGGDLADRDRFRTRRFELLPPAVRGRYSEHCRGIGEEPAWTPQRLDVLRRRWSPCHPLSAHSEQR